MEVFYDVIDIVGLFVQVIGLLLFGVASGWFTLNMITQPDKNWQLLSVVYGVFLIFVTLLARYLTPGAFGAFLVGAAGAMIYWGLIKNREKPEKKK
jgi:xanthine/uracil permease